MNTPVDIYTPNNANNEVPADSSNLTEDQLALKLTSIEELNVPEFKVSDETEMLMTQVQDPEVSRKFLMKNMDITRQQMGWLIPRVKQISNEVRKTNGTCIQLRNWKHNIEKDVEKSISFVKQQKIALDRDSYLKHWVKSAVVFLVGVIGGIITSAVGFSELFNLVAK